MTAPLLSPRFLFRFSAPCLYTSKKWTTVGVDLDESYRLPSLGELEGMKTLADVRFGWNEAGLLFKVQVSGKQKPMWCRGNKLEDSDGIQLWIDTRDTHNIHRASRFCHRFIYLPAGGGREFELPVADQLIVDRARENANPVRPGKLQIFAAKRADGYVLSGWIPEEALTGYNPAEHPKLGFTYWLLDRERGEQTFSCGSEFPFAADPSLWGTLELVK